MDVRLGETDLRRRTVRLMERGARRLEEAIPVSRKAHATLERAFSPYLARQLAVDRQGFQFIEDLT